VAVHGRKVKGNGYDLKQENKEKPSLHPVRALSGNMFFSLSCSPAALLHAAEETQQLAEMYNTTYTMHCHLISSAN